MSLTGRYQRLKELSRERRDNAVAIPRCREGEDDVQDVRVRRMATTVAVAAFMMAPCDAAETRAIVDGLEVHETIQILDPAEPTHIETHEACANAQAGWKIEPGSVAAQVTTARMTDPGGDPDWKAEKAEARTRIEGNGTRICLWAYCQGPLQYQCEIQAKVSWRESN